MRKILSIVIMLSIVVLITACKTTTTKEKSTTGATTQAPKITIKFAAQNDNTPATQKLIEAYNASQDKYVVEWEKMTNNSGQMHDQLLTSLSSSASTYDVISMDVVWAGEFAGAGYLYALDAKMIASSLNKTSYNAGSMAAGNYSGKQYSLPFFPDLGLLYYRKDIVNETDAAKLISGNYTFDDLKTMASTYKGQKSTEFGYVFQAKQYEGLTCNLTEFTNAFSNVKTGLEMMRSFTTSNFVPEDILNFDEGATHTAFEQGKSVFARNWPYMYGRIKGQEEGVVITKDQVGVAPLPNGGSVGGWLLGINKNSTKLDGAWDFIKYAAGAEGQKIMSIQGGYLPGFNSVLTNADVLASNELLSFEGFKKALQTTISRPVSPDYANVSDTIQVEGHNYLFSGTGLTEVVAAIEAKLNR